MNWGMDNKDKFSGAYFGEIEKDQVGIIISANNGIIIGTLFFGSEKYSFLGTLNRSKIIEPNVIIEAYGNPAFPSISHQTDYEIRNDTLITRINEFKYIFIKYRSID